MPSHKHPEKEDGILEIATTGNPAADVEVPGADVSTAPAGPAGDTALAEQMQKLLAEKQDLTNTLLRRQADFDNYRKRVEKERQHERHRGVELLIERLLPVLDAFEQALARDDGSAGAEYRKGFELIQRQLWDVLSKQGLKRIDSVGKEFDPHSHHAIARVESMEHPEGIVLDELQAGYIFHDRVLRPAMVRVTVAPAAKSAPGTSREN